MEIDLKSNKEKVLLNCKDFLVSGEHFNLIESRNKGILKTLPVPSDLNSYYQSNNYISHTDSSKNLTEKIYQLIKKYMLGKKINWIEKFSEKGSILDFGAGTGEFILQAKNSGWKVNGVEPNKQARDLAILKGIEIKEDISQFKKASFDVITMWHVLEHIPNLEEKINEIKSLLIPGGILIIAVPNYKSYDAEYYKEFWAAYDVPRHLWHFSQPGIKNLMRDFGFDQFETKALKFDAFYVSLLSEKYKESSAQFFKAFYRGLKSNLKARQTSEYSSLVYFFKNT